MPPSAPISRTEAPIRIVIVNDHPLFSDGFTTMLKMIGQIQIIGEANNREEFIDLVEDKQPDVVIIDIDIPDICGEATITIIRKKFPEVEVIAFSMYADEHLFLDLLEAGAKGFLLKKTNKNEIITAIETVSKKGTYYCKEISNKMVKLVVRGNFHPYKQQKLQFTSKELQIIKLLCQEYGSKEIANKMNINCRSIESSRQRILEKTGAKNMVGIAKYAIRNGIFILD